MRASKKWDALNRIQKLLGLATVGLWVAALGIVGYSAALAVVTPKETLILITSIALAATSSILLMIERNCIRADRAFFLGYAAREMEGPTPPPERRHLRAVVELPQKQQAP